MDLGRDHRGTERGDLGEPAGPLSARLSELCRAAVVRADPDTALRIRSIDRGLRTPLTVAVAGRVSSGKSTIVNALIGRRVAPTDVGECTRLVTWFRYGSPDRVVVVMNDDTITTRALDTGMIPSSLNCDLNAVHHLEVFLTIDALRSLSLIDTPGLASANADVSAGTRRLLGADLDPASTGALASADAALFVLNQTPREDDVSVLSRFRRLAAPAGSSAVNAIGVLGRADTLGDGDTDPWVVATELARRHASALASEVSTVVPLVGLLAETAVSGRFSEADGDVLRQLAALGDATVSRMLWSADRFIASDVGVDESGRRRLLDRLGLFGVAQALEAHNRGLTSAASIQRRLLDASGLAALQEAMRSTFVHRSDAIKASSALSALERLADQEGPGGGWLASAVEHVRYEPAMHVLCEVAAAQAVASGAVNVGPERAQEVARMAGHSEPAARLGVQTADREALAAAALEGARRWRRYAFGAAPAEAQVAETMERAHHLLWNELRNAPASVAGGISRGPGAP